MKIVVSVYVSPNYFPFIDCLLVVSFALLIAVPFVFYPASSGFSRPDATLRWERNHCEQPFAFSSSMRVHVMTTNIQRQDGNENLYKTIGLISKTTTQWFLSLRSVAPGLEKLLLAGYLFSVALKQSSQSAARIERF